MASQKHILKSFGIIGSSKLITIAIGVVRTKIIAVLLGPTGVGIAGILDSTISLVSNFTHMGIEFSAVRDVAEAAETGDNKKIAKAIIILRRWSWFTGGLGMLTAILLSEKLSLLGFGNDKYALGIAILSATILISSISSGQMALLQGMQQLASIAKSNVLGVVIGFAITVPVYYIYGIDGIVPALFVSPVAALCLSWWYAKRVSVEKIALSIYETFLGGIGMVKLGFFMVLSTLMMTGTMYLVKIIIISKSSIDVVGQFQAVWTLSSVYLMTVVNTMSVDYYPRLAGVNKDNSTVNLLVNEQLEIAMLVSAPLIVFMLSFASDIIPFFYSKSFVGALTILQWQLLGDFFKIIFFPLAYVLLAKKEGMYFIVGEFLAAALFVCVIYFGWDFFGKDSLGIGYFISRFFYMVLIWLFVRQVSGFRLNTKNFWYMVFFALFVLVSFLNSYFIDGYMRYVISLLLVLVVGVFSAYELNRVIDVLGFLKKKFSSK
jgi:PST family polysaccharide transporter